MMKGADIHLADTHTHLTAAEFAPDREAVIDRAQEAGVTRILVLGINLQSSREAVSLAGQHQNIYAAVGVHPHHADEWRKADRSELLDLASNPKVMAIGEIGLDFYRDYSRRENQRSAFADQLDLARDVNLPVSIHHRQSIDEVLRVLADWTENLEGPIRGKAGVLHAYSGGTRNVQPAVELGFFFGIGGQITYENAGDVREAVASIPEQRLITETDSPFLTPHPHRGKRNEPGNVRFVVERLAQEYSGELNQMAQRTFDNANTLFGWDNGNQDVRN